jgi:hypothetical protein
MALPVTITGISTAVAPVGPFKVAAGNYAGVGIDTAVVATTAANLTGGTTTTALAQTLTNGASALTIPSVTVWMSITGAPADNVYAEITATDANGSVLATSANVPCSSITGTGFATANAITFTFASPPTISASATFAVRFWRTGGADVSNFPKINSSGATSVYAGGSFWLYNGTTWSTGNGDYQIVVNKTVTLSDAYYFFGRDGTTATTLQAYKAGLAATFFTITTANTNPFSFGDVVSSTRRSQSFTMPSGGGSVGQVAMFLTKTGTPTDNLQMDIYATNGAGLVTGTSLGSATTISGSSLSTTMTQYTFTFSSPVALTGSTQYAAVISRSGGNNTSNYYNFGTQGAEVNSSEKSGFDNGGTWSTITTDASLVVMGPSGDATTGWSSIATRTGFTTAILNIAGYQVGNVIHLLVQDGTGPATLVATKYLSFDAATDTFLATTETVSAAQILTGSAASGWGCSLVVRSNGNVVCFYNGLQTKVSTQWARVYYRVRTGVNTFAAAEALVDAGLGVNNTVPIAVLGSSDRTHLLFFNGTNTLQRHLTSANVLGTVASTGATTAVQDACRYDSSGTIKHVGYTAAQSIRWDSADNPTVTAASITFGTPVRATDDGTDAWALYQNSADSDLYTKKSTDNGATFGTGTDVFTATVTAADANVSKNQAIYLRGTQYVIPYLANDGGTWKYNEAVVRTTGPVDHPLTASGGSYLLTGTTTPVLVKRRIDATTAASYALAGASTTNVLHKSRIDATTGGAYALTGASTTSLLHKYRPAALGGSYALTGTDAAVTKGILLVNKTLPAGGGSYAVTGAATSNLLHQWKVVATTPATYSLAGAATTNVLHKDRLTAGAASYALTGTDAAVIKRTFKTLAAVGGSYALTGSAAAVLHAWRPIAGGGSYALTGTAATLTRFANKSLAAGSSSYALTGTAANVRHGWKVVATTPAAYALTGNAATFVIHRDLLSAAPGVYALTGTAVNFQIRSDKFVSAASGVYALSGTAVTMRRTYKPAALAGSYAVTGNAATTVTKFANKFLVAGTTSYALSGAAASVLHTWKHAALGGSYTVTGTAARPWHGYKVIAAASSYAVTGSTATINHVPARTITAAPGSYALMGTDASARRSLKLFAPIGGSYALTGGSARPWHGYKVLVGSANYALTGAAVTLARLRKVVTAETGAYALSGKPALVLYNWRLPAAGSSYAITGQPAILRRARKLQAAAASYALTGSSAIINRIGLWSVVAEPGHYVLTGNVARIFGGEWTISDRTVQAVAELRSIAVAAEIRTVKAATAARMVRVPAELRSVSAPEEFRTIQARGESHGVSTMATQGSG